MTTQNDTITIDGDGATADVEDLIDVLLTELKADQGGARKAALRRALDVDDSTSTDVRLDHLQSTVDSLSAYTDALEAFLDENGTADEVFTSVQADLESAVADIETLREETTTLETTDDELEERIEHLERTIDALDDRFSLIEDSTRGLRQDFASARGSLEDSVTELNTGLDHVVEQIKRLNVRLTESNEEFDARASTLHARLDSLESRLDTVETTVEADIDDVETTLEDAIGDLEEDVDALEEQARREREWRDSLQTAFQ